ncbi:MAG: 23S rRNA (guanosine(2251)-2'-O)-methyltransferase RlmB [Emergencia sp.]|jgi:23S rRNA (guanosine2251-2'-O)-methyltransferase|nr:23S rRNA (guanosine(2251)-2'-O)-methyltransferase RlmB [Emergencia sp.]
MAKNKRDWASINARKGKAYRAPEEAKASRRSERNTKSAGTKTRQGEEKFWQAELPAGAILGRNPVIEALRNDREMEKILVGKGAEGSIAKIIAMAKEKAIPIYQSDKQTLDRIASGAPHQGVIAYASAYHYSEMEDIYAKAEVAGEQPLIVILDNLEDPHNLGAIMRSAECAGAHGVIIPKRRSCGLTETVAKSSAGAVEYMPCVKVANIGQAIDALKEDGFWIAACDMDGVTYYQQDLTGKLAIVIGSEGAGISPLVKKKCDFTVSMPMVGNITSLNASNAAAVLLYEVRRQRDGK